jgi:hypothetical protein
MLGMRKLVFEKSIWDVVNRALVWTSKVGRA